MGLKFNVFTGTLDYTGAGSSGSETDPLSLHLDQTTPQNVINGSPEFNEGLRIKSGKKLIFDGS